MQSSEMRRILSCPINGTPCLEGSRADFQKDEVGKPILCRWWTHVYGKDPQSEKLLDHFDCAIAWLPVVTLEVSQMTRFNTASTDKVANQILELAGSVKNVGSAMREALEMKQERILLDHND